MLTKKEKRSPRHAEKTGSQTVYISYGDNVLHRSTTSMGTIAQLRVIRKDPTVALARALLVSCIQAGSWNIETDQDVSDEVKEFIEHILPLRENFIYNALAFGKVDFGWCGFEKIFKVKNNRIEIEHLKPLLHDMTTILVTPKGRFNGFRQTNSSGFTIDLYPEKCINAAFEVEAGNYYGNPLLENIRQTCSDWEDCNDGAKRYDTKLAGTHWVVYYPPGESTVDGEEVNNGETAAVILDALMSSGGVTIPTTIVDYIQELNGTTKSLFAWKVELISDQGGKQESFGTRLKYLDSQKVRGILMPERALLEGQYGTKAESETHGGLMLNNLEAIDRTLIKIVNEQLVNQLVRLNFGDEMVGKVCLVATPLVDAQIKFIRKLYIELKDQDIDMQVLRDKLDIATEIGGSETKIPNFNKKEEGNDEE